MRIENDWLKKQTAEISEKAASDRTEFQQIIDDINLQLRISETKVKTLEDNPRVVNYNNYDNRVTTTYNTLIMNGPVSDLSPATIAAAGPKLKQKHLLQGSPGLVTFLMESKILVKVQSLSTVNYYKTNKKTGTFKYLAVGRVIIIDMDAAQLRQALQDSNIVTNYLVPMSNEMVADARKRLNPLEAMTVMATISSMLGECQDLMQGVGKRRFMFKLNDVATPLKNLRPLSAPEPVDNQPWEWDTDTDTEAEGENVAGVEEKAGYKVKKRMLTIREYLLTDEDTSDEEDYPFPSEIGVGEEKVDKYQGYGSPHRRWFQKQDEERRLTHLK